MRIVKVVAKGLPLYQDEMLTLDLYATDRVAKMKMDLFLT